MTYNWRSTIRGRSCGAHLWRDEPGVDAGTGQRAVHLVMTHHSKGASIGASDGQRRSQSRSRCKTDVSFSKRTFHIRRD